MGSSRRKFGAFAKTHLRKGIKIAEAPSSIPSLPRDEMKWGEKDNRKEEQNSMFDEKEFLLHGKEAKKVCITIHRFAT
ncbi:hypothetical protein N9D57_03380 [bacterium]|nr:hypothetical protein [bacterium]